MYGVVMAIFITGGAGFVGSNLAKKFRDQHSNKKIICFDNLKRRGAETNLSDFKKLNIDFFHGDIRHLSDLLDVNEEIELIVEASAEPSVHAGTDGSADYLLETNLWGTKNCLEFARVKKAPMIFLSTSRVYSIDALTSMALDENETRFEISKSNDTEGLTEKGVAENFDTSTSRSLYGASKLCSEILIQEYISTFGLKIIRNRCGVIAGPGQWGKVDQGVFTLWMANHYFKQPLKYTGFGGNGKQVRDLLHPDDLFEVLNYQIAHLDKLNGECFNIGGGMEVSTSLYELTKVCAEITGNEIKMGSDPETAKVDIPLYVSDYSKFQKLSSIAPRKNVVAIMNDIFSWIKENESTLRPFFT